MKKLIIGNWKMNPDSSRVASTLFQSYKTKGSRLRRAKVIICAPFVYLETLAKKQTTQCAVGAQSVFFEESGAHTGRVSPRMLRNLKVNYVIVGHSEQREGGVTNEIVNKKVKAAFDERLKVVLCIGEHERDDEGEYLSYIKEQLKVGLGKIPKKFYVHLIVAYEPIWAIGEHARGASTPEDFLEQALYIRKVLAQLTDKETAMKVPVLYGGSVNEQNAEGFLREGRADGLLVGRASLDADSFKEILSLADTIK